MTEYVAIFSSEKKKEELYIENADFGDFHIDNKHSISFANDYYFCSIHKKCHFNAVRVDNQKCSYRYTETLKQGLEIVGNYSLYIQTYPYENEEKCFTITQLINHLLKEIKGDFCFGNICGGEILLRTNGKIYLNYDYPECHLLKFDEIEI